MSAISLSGDHYIIGCYSLFALAKESVKWCDNFLIFFY